MDKTVEFDNRLFIGKDAVEIEEILNFVVEQWAIRKVNPMYKIINP